MHTVFPVRIQPLIIRMVLLALVIVSATIAFAKKGDDPPFSGVELAIPDETVPPGGMLQLKVQITEPKPISKGGQKARFAARMLGAPVGIELFSPGGDASGTAVLSNGAAEFSLSSSLVDMGQSSEYPIVTIAMPVKANAVPWQTADLTLDPALSQWLDPAGQNYPVLLSNGIFTVGGTLSISNIVPGGGVVAAGTKIAIQGMGFQRNSRVQIEEAKVAKQTYVSANEIDITLARATNMTSRRVRVTNPASNERVEYFSYARTVQVGKSKHALIGATVPLFSQTTWTVAYLRPVLSGSQFTGLAVQNASPAIASVKLQISSSNGSVLKTRVIKLGAYHRISRDLTEFFAGVVPANGTTVRVSSVVPVQVLGLLGDDVLGTVDPMNPTPNP